MLNTHYYDAKLGPDLEKLKNHIHRVQMVPKTEKLKAFAVMSASLSEDANVYLGLIVSAYGTPANYDPSNSYHAEDVMYLCCELAMNSKIGIVFIEELDIQLADIRSGGCPQGRTHRLLQILMAFEEFLPLL